MRFKELAGKLTGEPAKLWLVTGEEPLLMIEAADMIRAAAKKAGYGERQILNGQANWDWSQVREACTSMSLFAEKRIVELRLASFRVGTKGAEALTALASAPLEDTIVIVSMPSDWTVKKLAWYKKLSAAAQVVECAAVTVKELPLWFRERLARHELSADGDAVNLLTERCEGNLLAAAQEVLKLAYQYPKGTRITAEMIERAVGDVARFDIENLISATFTGDAAKALRIVENLKAEGEAMPAIVWQFTDETRAALLTRTYMDQGENVRDAMMHAGVRGFDKTARIQSVVNRNNSRRLEAALTLCADLDRLGKGLKIKDRDSDVWLELASLAAFLAH